MPLLKSLFARKKRAWTEYKNITINLIMMLTFISAVNKNNNMYVPNQNLSRNYLGVIQLDHKNYENIFQGTKLVLIRK